MKKGKIIFILGGARSGKSNYAISLAKRLKKKVIFIATCNPLDEEMKERVKKHRKSRPNTWKTIEEEIDIDLLLQKLNRQNEIIIIDCLTIWISNLQLKYKNEEKIEDKIKSFLKVLEKIKTTLIIVSNEVGSGIVPENKIARNYRDILGNLNQEVAKLSSEVYFLISGVPIKIKRRDR